MIEIWNKLQTMLERLYANESEKRKMEEGGGGELEKMHSRHTSQMNEIQQQQHNYIISISDEYVWCAPNKRNDKMKVVNPHISIDRALQSNHKINSYIYTRVRASTRIKCASI